MKVRASGSLRRYVVDHRALEGGVRKLREEGAELEKKLHAGRFRSIDAAGSELSSIGWCRPEGTVPREWVAEDQWRGRVLGAALRIDKKQLPPGALRVRRMEAEAAERRNAGERIAPARRREIAEKLEGELIARMVPATALHTMLWDVEADAVLLNTTADGANIAFRALFRETFGVAPEPLTVGALAARFIEEKKLNALVPALFTEGGVVLMNEPAAFLGGEFLLWLWYCGENHAGEFELPDLGKVAVTFDALLELGGGGEAAGKVSVRGDAPTRAPEAGSALLSGRLPSKARLVLGCGEKNFDVTIGADRFDLEALKVTAEAEEISDENLRAGDEQRARWLFEVSAAIDALFGEFLKLRVTRAFDAELLPSMRRWIATRGRGKAKAASGA